MITRLEEYQNKLIELKRNQKLKADLALEEAIKELEKEGQRLLVYSFMGDYDSDHAEEKRKEIGILNEEYSDVVFNAKMHPCYDCMYLDFREINEVYCGAKPLLYDITTHKTKCAFYIKED